MELTVVVLEVLMVLLEAIIVYILLDDIYGITALRKLSKRRWRKYWRKFWCDSKTYHKKTRRKA